MLLELSEYEACAIEHALAKALRANGSQLLSSLGDIHRGSVEKVLERLRDQVEQRQ